MIYSDEAEVLEEAFFRSDVGDVTQLEYYEEDIQEYADFLEIERDILPDLQSYFSVTEKDLCEKHRIPLDGCGCSDARESSFRLYRLNAEALMEEWYASIEDRGMFDSCELEQLGPNRWLLSARIDRTELSFQCFFSKQEFDTYYFEHHALEFGVSFFGDSEAIERDYCYSWIEFIEEDFADTLTRDIKQLKDATGTDFYEFKPLEGYRDRVRQSLRTYFAESGYEVRREVNEICAVETSRYGIDTGKTDFVSSLDESKFVVCHCEKTPGWHVHHFRDGRIESAEQTAVIEDMTGKIESKINEYQDIQSDKQTASRFVNVVSALFSIGFVLLLIDQLGSISAFLRQQFQLGGSLEAVGVILLVLDAIAVIVLTVVITLPYYLDYRFDWGIEPLDGHSNTEVS